MINEIVKALKDSNIDEYLVREDKIESSELFFIKKELDMNRRKKVRKYEVVVYKNFEKDGEKFKGSATINLYPTMSYEELCEGVKGAYFAAGFVCNKHYTLPKGEVVPFVEATSDIKEMGVDKAALEMAEGLFKYDNFEKGFVNSGEIFAIKKKTRIVNSEGIDVSYESYETNGEYIAEWIENGDVETYRDFKFGEALKEELGRSVKETIEITEQRDKACELPKSGKYTCIISGPAVEEFAFYYKGKSNAANIYQRYSDFKVGENVQGEGVIGDKINMDLIAKVPYSEEGLSLKDTVLIEDGVLKTLHGESRFSQYLEVNAAPNFPYVKIHGGSKSIDDMKNGDYINVVNFSGFQVDMLTGDFAGEIRLAFVKEGDKIVPVTGGSISGSLVKCQKEMYLSKEMQCLGRCEVPACVEMKDVVVAGR
ncbi:MAG: metallopeptidase TldD-related protein [Clostridium sp.]